MSSQGGFALLITITLLGFLLVLLLGLAVYTRVETSVAGNTQRQSQARENAMLALNVALAQLQKHAGPDTRVTATAANFGAIDGTRHYTGVWSSDPARTTPLTWLVLVVVCAILAPILPIGEHVDTVKTLTDPGYVRPDLFSEHPLGTNQLALDELAAWYRDLVVVAAGAPSVAMHADRLAELQEDGTRDRMPGAEAAAEAVRDTWRLFEELQLQAGLALEALFVRLRRELASPVPV